MQHWRDIMLINRWKHSGVVAATLLIVIPSTGCKQDPVDSSLQRIRLGAMEVAMIPPVGSRTEVEFGGRLRAYDTRDTLFEGPGGGSFKHFLSFRDTTSLDSLRVFYTLPLNANFRRDSTQRFTFLYRQIESRFALLLKTKNDSLVCAFGTLLPDEWVFVLNRAGTQGFRISVGENLYLARNTACGREGDFDMIVTANSGEVRVGPARGAFLFSGDKVYAVFNVVNTKLIKDLGRCPDFAPEFGMMILQQ